MARQTNKVRFQIVFSVTVFGVIGNLALADDFEPKCAALVDKVLTSNRLGTFLHPAFNKKKGSGPLPSYPSYVFSGGAGLGRSHVTVNAHSIRIERSSLPLEKGRALDVIDIGYDETTCKITGFQCSAKRIDMGIGVTMAVSPQDCQKYYKNPKSPFVAIQTDDDERTKEKTVSDRNPCAAAARKVCDEYRSSMFLGATSVSNSDSTAPATETRSSSQANEAK